MRSLRPFTALLACVLAVVAATHVVPSVSAYEHLANGEFDQTPLRWVALNAGVGSCAPSDGGTAMRLAPTNTPAKAIQIISGPLAAGDYTLTGAIVRTSGNQILEVMLTSRDAAEVPLGAATQTVPLSSLYESFTLQLNVLPNAASARLEFTVLNGSPATVVCIDSLSLQGPPLATATPIPTDTPSASPTGTASALPTTTATPTRTPHPGYVFRNGSFEDGFDGWQKFGGELDVTGAPIVSGLQAGVLSSSTSSTKWAYQTVAIDAQRYYQFSGYLWPEAGVANALLRVSWYASSDGSGEAISSVDSTASVPEGSSGYTWLTTGPVLPPPNAKTARTRVLLTPAGASATELFMDDLEFTAVEPATATPVPASTSTPASATSTPVPAITAAPRTSDGAVLAPITPVVEPTRVSEVSSTRQERTRTPEARVGGVRDERPAGGDDGVPLIWLVGAGALVVGLVGAYFQNRHKT